MTARDNARSDRASPVARASRGAGIWSLGARLTRFSVAHPWPVVIAGLALAVASIGYAATHFSMSTDTDELISKTLPWRVRNAAFDKAFPPPGQIVIVVDARTPELADEAVGALADRLRRQTRLFRHVTQPDGGTFWRQNGLLYASTPEVSDRMSQLIKAEPFIGSLAADPSLRGLAGAFSTFAGGVGSGSGSLADLDRPAGTLATALETLEAGQPAFFSWRSLVGGGKVDPRELRRLILADPVLDFSQLQPGAAAEADIRQTARSLGLDAAHGVRVRLTGHVPVADEEFSTLADRALLIGSLAFTAILTMLWLAVRSPKTMVAILLTMIVGLEAATALGLLIFHRFNVISVAFIPLFVGLGIDFGIQFSVRFRAEQGAGKDVAAALVEAGRGMGPSLTVAAAAISAGFLAFAPTAYVGVSQLGTIAGLGLIFALILNLSLLPAILALWKPAPPSTTAPPAPIRSLDGFMSNRRGWVVGTAAAAAIVSACLLPLLRFDFNPMHLRSPTAESMATLADLMRDPQQSPNTLELVAPDLDAAQAIAAQMSRLPQVGSTRDLDTFVPADQPAKLAAIRDASDMVGVGVDPVLVQSAPTDAAVQSSLAKAASDLRVAASGAGGQGATNTLRLAAALDRLAHGSPALRAQAADLLIAPLNTMLSQIRDSLDAQPITLAALPADIRSQWLTADGRARVSIIPSGDSNDNEVLARFIDAVRALQPNVAGTPITIREEGRTIVGAFVEAGVLSFIAITLLLFAIFRRVREVAITMAPIVLTGLLTLATCVVIDQPLNYANIIALPLLFGIGVAFHIYFVMSWRSGGTHLLESSLSRGVFFSALTTATGFGSLWASSHPGMASMGELLMISLAWTLVSALLFQPALMGPPPRRPARSTT